MSADAGQTFSVPFAGGPLLGFALSPGGEEIFLGGVEDGLWAARRGALDALEQRSRLPIVCLAHAGDVLYACSDERGGFALGASRDGGRSFEPRLVLSDVRGPLACAQGTSLSVCAADWPMTSDRLGIEPERALEETTAPGVPGSDAAASETSLAGGGGSGCSVVLHAAPGEAERALLLAPLLVIAARLGRKARA